MAKPKESLRLCRYWDEIERLYKLDIRFWKDTKKGPRPTSRGVSISAMLITRLIAALQEEHAAVSREAAKAFVGTED